MAGLWRTSELGIAVPSRLVSVSGSFADPEPTLSGLRPSFARRLLVSSTESEAINPVEFSV